MSEGQDEVGGNHCGVSAIPAREGRIKGKGFDRLPGTSVRTQAGTWRHCLRIGSMRLCCCR